MVGLEVGVCVVVDVPESVGVCVGVPDGVCVEVGV